MTLLLKETPEQLILRVADSLQPAVRKTFVDAVNTLKSRVPLGELTELLEAGKLSQAIDTLNISLTSEELAPIRDALQDAVRRTATPTAAEFGLSFDVVQPRAVRWATEQAGRLIVQIDSETRQAVADIVSKGLREGVAPRQQALLIREIVGLTRRDAGAVDRSRIRDAKPGCPNASGADGPSTTTPTGRKHCSYGNCDQRKHGDTTVLGGRSRPGTTPTRHPEGLDHDRRLTHLPDMCCVGRGYRRTSRQFRRVGGSNIVHD